MGEGVESRHVGNLRHVVLAFFQQVCRAVEFVPLEEYGRIFSGKALHLVVELGAGDFHHFRHAGDVQVVVGEFLLHELVQVFHESGVTGRQRFRRYVFRGGHGAQLPVQFLPVLQQGLHQGGEIGGLEGLGHVGVGPFVQALDLVFHGHLGGDQHHGDVAQLEIALDGLAEFVAAHTGHHYIGNHQVRRVFLFHSLQGRCPVEVHGNLVGRLKQHLEVVGNVDVVVHYHDVPATGLGLRFCRGSVLRGYHDLELGLFRGTLVFRVGTGAYGQDEVEQGAAIFPVPGLDIAVVEATEGPRIEQADSRALRLLSAGRLEEALEDLLQLVFGDARTIVGHADRGVLPVRIGRRKGETGGGLFPGDDVEREAHLTAGRGELEGVGEQVHHNFLHLVRIHPHSEGLFQAIGDKVDTLGFRVEAEQGGDVPERAGYIHLGHLHLQLLVADAVEVQQLVHQR